MSSEFTPESERQRLQFLVSDPRNFVYSEASHRIGGECFFLSLRRRNCKYLDIWNNGIAGLDMRWWHQSLFKLSELWLWASHRIYKPTSDLVPSIRRALCSHTCWETSSHTWNFPAESRGKRWAERCSTEISPWTDGKWLLFSLCLIFCPWSWRWAWMAGSTERPANVTWPAALQPCSCVCARWSNNLQKISLLRMSAALEEIGWIFTAEALRSARLFAWVSDRHIECILYGCP